MMMPSSADEWSKLHYEGDLKQLDQLMELINGSYRFEAEVYPEISQCDYPDFVQHFAVRHSALHMMKSLGAIASEAESADHGDAINVPRLATICRKELVNILKLAAVLGITAGDLIDDIVQVYADRYKTGE